MYFRRTNYFFQIVSAQLGVGLMITLTALAIVCYAEGYRFNYRNLKFVKTGIIALQSQPKDVAVYLNGKIKSKKTNFSTAVLSGTYDLLIKKEGYVDWSLRAKVEPELVSSYKNIILFKTNPVTSELTDRDKIDQIWLPTDVLARNSSDTLVYSNHEIWIGTNLVARFSNQVYRAIWFPGGTHIVYQSGKEIRVIERAGTNDTLLVTLSEDKPSTFIVGSRGQELYFIDSGQYRIATIR